MKTNSSVIHIVENLDRGAVENWLVRMLRLGRLRDLPLDWTFYCAFGHWGTMDETARSLGARVVYSPFPIARKVGFVRALRKTLHEGRYDVLHSHHDLVSAVYLVASVGLPIARRIVHVHNADEDVLTPNAIKRRLYREPMRRICLANADRIVGISNHTLDTFLAGRARRSGRDVVHYYGVDPAPFEDPAYDHAAFRNELGVPDEALILLFAGRLVPEKNPLFAVDVLAEMRRLENRAVLAFAGAGSQEQAVMARARRLGVEDSTRLLGWRNDVARIMCCSDWFILPRPEQPLEGFGLAVIEAQLAGLRMLLSRGVVDDALLPKAVFRRLSLTEPASVWAEAALQMLKETTPSREAALAVYRRSPMEMDYALEDLLGLYS